MPDSGSVDLGVRGRGFVVVGGTAGMGLAAAEVLAEEGANVALVARNVQSAERAAASLADRHGVKAIGLAADVSQSADEVDAAILRAHQALGEIAGLAVTTGTDYEHSRRPLADTSDDDWRASFEDIALGTIRCCRAVLPRLIGRGGGTIVTTAAYSVHAPDPPAIAYSSLKSAVATYTKGLAKTYGPSGVRANCICPGAIKSERVADMLQGLADGRGIPHDLALERAMLDEWHLDIGLGRFGRTREVGELMAFLLSERAAYLTGALINIDGGTNF